MPEGVFDEIAKQLVEFLRMVSAGKGRLATGSMILTALLAMRMAAGRAYWFVRLISFASLPIRGAAQKSPIRFFVSSPYMRFSILTKKYEKSYQAIVYGIAYERNASPDFNVS